MSNDSPGTLELLALQVGRALQSLGDQLSDDGVLDFLSELGFNPPDGFLDKITTEVGAAASAASQLGTLVTALDNAISAPSPNIDDIVSAGKALFNAIGGVVKAVSGIATAIGTQAQTFPAPPADQAEIAAFGQQFLQRALSFVIFDLLESTFPKALTAGLLVGLFDDDINPGIDGSIISVPFEEKVIHFDQIGSLFSSPQAYLQSTFGWGAQTFDGLKLFLNLKRFLETELSVAADLLTPPGVPAVLEIYTFSVAVLPAVGATPPGLKVSLRLPAIQDFQIAIPWLDQWSLDVEAKARFVADTEADIVPPFSVTLVPPQGTVDVSVTFGLTRNASAPSLLLAGDAKGSRLEIGHPSIALGVEAKFDSATHQATTEPSIEASFKDGLLVIGMGGRDGFLSDAIGSNDIQSKINLDAKWTPSTGLTIATSGISITLPVNQTIGPVDLQAIHLALGLASDAVQLTTSLDAAVALGPITASVSGIGASVNLAFPKGGGNLGPLDLSVHPDPPTGVGLAVNAGPVSGGGFISFDKDAGRYSGALALQVYSVAVKAFGVIDTKLPAGGPAFSFFIIISAEFNPIQLGFGFTLLGVGGLLGINRDLNEDALATAVKAGNLDNVLFPKDPIRDAPTILADVETLFPPTKGFYAFGPLARIGWGTPAIIDARIGIILVFPGPNIALLGVITALLPPGAKDPQLRLVEIHMDIDGILDFPKKHFEMDAHLHDSQVRGFPISGDMAARMDWGTNPNFAVSLGGFHPHYTPPAGFPTLRRLSIDLGIKGNPSATLSGYMALTSNTAQVGAALDVSAHANGASLNGGLAFDALFVFSPFSFDATLEGGVHVDFHGAGFGMHFHGEIGGPAPWHLHGDVCVSVLWWDACVGFDLTLGGENKPELPAIDIWAGSTPDANQHQDVPGLQSAVVAPGNWTGVLPTGGYQVVSITQSDSTHSRVDPLGVATFQQKVAPLQLAISKFAGRSRAKNDVVTVTLKTLTVNGVDLATKPVSDFFAPVQYQNVPDSQALSAPSFQPLPAGFSFSSDDIVFGTEQTKPVAITTFIIGSTATPTYNVPSDTQLLTMTGRSATATGGLRKANIDRFVDLAATIPFALANEVYVLALKSTLARYTGDADSDDAYALKADKLAALSPALRATLQIVPSHELA